MNAARGDPRQAGEHVFQTLCGQVELMRL